MKVVVLGTGLLGVTTAWYLAEDGHEVTVIDRQAEPALESSFANGGQISVCHAAPWANPGAPWQVAKWLGQEDAPLLRRLRADPAQWAWGLRFLVECSAARARKNTSIKVGWLLSNCEPRAHETRFCDASITLYGRVSKYKSAHPMAGLHS